MRVVGVIHNYRAPQTIAVLSGQVTVVPECPYLGMWLMTLPMWTASDQ